MLRTIILMTRGILLDTRVRRGAMFILLMAAMVMLFAGTTFLAGNLPVPWGFVIYWFICAWMTVAALMLALWDILLLRIAARKERRRIAQEFIKEKKDEEP